jgi:hypothetical protein
MLRKILTQLLIILLVGIVVWFCVLPRLVGGGAAPGKECKMEMAQISAALKKFEVECGKLPTGDNATIFRTLYGSNSLNLCFLNPGRTISGSVMVDPWKSPYQIQFIDQTNFLIQSAGKNAKFGDEDDIVFNSVSNDFVKP